ELGDDELNIHRHTGEELGKKDIDILIGVRGLAKELAEGARAGGIAHAGFAVDSDKAGEMVCDLVRPGDVILVKGSRGVKTEKVIEKLLGKFGLEGEVKRAA